MPKSTKEEVYQFILGYVKENLFAPSLAEISEGVGITSQTVAFHINELEKDGRIQHLNTSRGIKLVGYKLVKEGIGSVRDKVRQGLLEL